MRREVVASLQASNLRREETARHFADIYIKPLPLGVEVESQMVGRFERARELDVGAPSRPGVRHVRLVSDEAGERDAGDYTTRVEREVVVDRVDHLVADAVSLARHDVNLAVEIQDAHRTQEDAALRLDDASARERGVVAEGP